MPNKFYEIDPRPSFSSHARGANDFKGKKNYTKNKIKKLKDMLE
jgi:hypothetical protein